MSQRRNYEVRPDVTLTPEEEERATSAVEQADRDVPPTYHPITVDGVTVVVPIVPASVY